ncbi:MAG: Holliday junction branch migration DNA helicase RuvB, partial [Candidatus Harrisonbacteria bacterium]|nr:Holliday junction branch migration DNA helicase RuvB [Candidatus Harrisonbacteria bacterium]
MSNSKEQSPDELTLDAALRPTTWGEYIGQEKTKRNLRVMLDAAKKRSETPD